MPAPFVALGTVKIDNQGRYTAHGTASAGGQVQDADWSGSIQVNPDCTATDTYTYGPFQGADRWVILGSGNEMRSFPTKLLGSPTAAMYYYWRIARGEEPNCTSDMVRGVYGGSAEGIYMIPVPGQPQPVPTPFSGIFTQTFRYGGTGTAVATGSMGGSIFDVEFPEMSMKVNPDCTATMKYTGGVSKQLPGQKFSGTVKYIVLNDGNELIGMETESNVGLPIVLENHKRISIIPLAADR